MLRYRKWLSVIAASGLMLAAVASAAPPPGRGNPHGGPPGLTKEGSGPPGLGGEGPPGLDKGKTITLSQESIDAIVRGVLEGLGKATPAP